MLEDCQIMEKKPNGRSVQPPAKGGGTENKKDSTNKPFGKYTRRREPSGHNNSKNECSRKPNPPKSGKFCDKRPRPRSQYNGCRAEDTKVAEEHGPEYGSVFVPGSKKQNLNHLLNFHYAPRDVSGYSGEVHRGQVVPARWLTTHKHKYNKEHFLQANCQFIVKECVDYTKYLSDPDLLVDWDAVEQVRLQCAELVVCPICLDTPTAAKMTRCGHVYCWPCVLHYLALSDKTWRKCPICYEAVHRKDLRSVVTHSFLNYKLGDTITFRLMRRERTCLTPQPADQSEHRAQGLLSMSEQRLDTVYSKLLLAKPAEVLSIVSVEREELCRALEESHDCPEVCFVEQAMELLKEREALLTQTVHAGGTVDCATQLGADEGLAAEIKELAVDEGTDKQRLESVSSEGGSEDELPNIAVEDLDITHHESCIGSKPFYFYQASDGQHVYLHALNVKMLVAEYQSLEQCPLEVEGRVVEKESGSMTDELRKRLRYLQHLPVTTQFEVVEVDLAGTVSVDVVDSFQEHIELRARRRHRRARDERRREKKINEEVNLKWGRHPGPRIRIESHRQFPLYGVDTAIAPPLAPVAPTPPGSLSRSHSLNSLSSIVDNAPLENAGPSFAQMLRDGSSRGSTREPRGSKTSAWGTALNKTEWPTPTPADPEVDGWPAAPVYKQSFSDAIATALERAEHAQDEDGPVSLKKKKKKKQKVLFVTGMACSTK